MYLVCKIIDIELINKEIAKLDGIKSIRSLKLPSSDGHVLYVEESGNRQGIPTLFLHGGPGAGIGQNYTWPFAHDDHWLIAFDQRGCGRSQPFVSLKHNTTEKCIDDIEAIRIHFNIDKWLIFGGSWGSTLALAYAIAHPNRVSGLVLRGIFLARDEDSDWFVSHYQGASQVFPKEYADFVKPFTDEHRDSNFDHKTLYQWYFSKLTSHDENVRNDAARRWFNWEGNICKLNKIQGSAHDFATNQQVYSLALLECYFLLNDCFMPANHIINNAKKINDIPTYIVHGRYDMVCKCESAITLHKAMPHSHLTIVEDAGHSMSEKGIGNALVRALNHIKISLTPEVEV
jgi:proline iminopeptidase